MTQFLKLAAAVAVASAFASEAFAAGFMLTEQSAGALGRAYAGVGVDGLDISGTYYNPATMVLHPGTKLQAGFVHIGVNAEYESLDGGAGENGRLKSQTIPHGYITHQINDSLWAGLAMTVPWGMGTQYDNYWEGAERGTETKMRSFDFNPNLAWKISDKLSVGAGVSVQYVAATLKMSQRMYRSDVYLGQVDGEYKADGIDWGWNLGAMWSPAENLRFGVSYRSEIEHHTEGTYTLRTDSRALNSAMQNILGTKDAELIVSGPAWAMATAAWDVNNRLSLYGTFRWTDWSSFTELNITDTSGNSLGSGPIQNHWKDAYLGSVGADYRISGEWTVRAGVGYESSPISNPRYRTAVIPDADRWWFAVGAGWKPMKNLQADMSLALLHGVHERNLYENERANSQPIGRYKTLDAYLLGFQLVYAF